MLFGSSSEFNLNAIRKLSLEADVIGKSLAGRNFRLRLLKSRYPRLFGNRIKVGRIHRRFRENTRQPTFLEIKQIYEAVSGGLSATNPNALLRTAAHHNLIRALNKRIRFEKLESIWIGRSNVDIFVPGISTFLKKSERGFKSTGLAIEVDGPVHDLENKSKKDTDKDEVLEFVGAMVIHIQNDETHLEISLRTIEDSYRAGGLDSREKTRLMLRVYLITIFLNWDLANLCETFGFKENVVSAELDRLTGVKKCR